MIKFFILILLIPSIALATPSTPTVTGTGPLTITGTSFTTKTTAAPKFFNSMEAVDVGSLPSGFTAQSAPGGPVSSTRGYSGSKAMQFDFSVNSSVDDEQFNRSVFDLGAGGADKVYISAWMYIDRTGSVCNTSPCYWQWKSLYVGGDNTSYTTGTANNTVTGLNNWWRENDTSWFNTFENVYYNGLTNGASGSPSIASNAWVWGEWQRIEYYIQRSSSPSVADGKFSIQRIGQTAILNETAAVTNDADDLPWRYIGFGQGIAAVTTANVGAGGSVSLKVFYDDIYIDNTPARVELCNANTKAASTHCELQIPTAWSDTEITTTYNPGSFTTGQTAYLYVIDSSGAVSPPSAAITINGGQVDVTKPTTSTNKPSARYTATQSVTLTCEDNVACTATKYCYGE